MRVLIVNGNTWNNPYPVYPLGVGYVASALRDAGHRVRVLDFNTHGDCLESAISGFGPDLVGYSIRNVDDCRMENTRFLALLDLDIVNRITRATTARVVLGGSAFSLYTAQFMSRCDADFGIRGEGERSVVALAAALENGSGVESIPGVVYRSGAGLTVNPAGSGTLERSPAERPADMVAYYDRESSMLNVQTQRGCALRCCYCSYPVIEGRTFRRREPGEIGDDFDRLRECGTRYVFVVDSVFNTSEEHVAGICEELVRRNTGVQWGCFLRPGNLTPELAVVMARAGLRHVEFGTDSFSDSVLHEYGKGFTFEDILRSSELLRTNKIHYAHFLIVGGPGENEVTLRETYENSKRITKTVIFPYVGMRVYPSTDLHARAIADELVDPASDLFEPSFYLSPQIGLSRVNTLLEEFAGMARQWVLGDPSPEALLTMTRLRSMGIRGPLWEYLAR